MEETRAVRKVRVAQIVPGAQAVPAEQVLPAAARREPEEAVAETKDPAVLRVKIREIIQETVQERQNKINGRFCYMVSKKVVIQNPRLQQRKFISFQNLAPLGLAPSGPAWLFKGELAAANWQEPEPPAAVPATFPWFVI